MRESSGKEVPAEDSTELFGEVERELLGKRRDLLAGVAEAGSTRQDRYSKSEVKFIATVPVGQLQKQVDALSKSFRELDTKIQELNWKTELI